MCIGKFCRATKLCDETFQRTSRVTTGVTTATAHATQ